MRKHKINSILFTIPDNDLSELFLKKMDQYNHFNDLFSQEIHYISNNKTRIDNLINTRQLVISFNIDFGFFISKEKFKEVALISNNINQEYLDFFNKVNLIGFQRHLIPKEILNGIDINARDNLSLGYIRSKPNLVEPVFRKSEIISFNLSSLKVGEGLNVEGTLPSGLTSDEFIQLVKYAGYSDRIKLLNFNFKLESSEEEVAELLASSIWYFLESLSLSTEEENFDKNIVHFNETDDYFNFIKSHLTTKCWVSLEGHDIKIACSIDEYDLAVKEGVISDRIIHLLYT